MPRTLQSAINESNPNKVADGLREVKAGDALALLPRFVTGAVAANILTLASAAKALTGVSAFATVAGSAGAKSFVPGGAPVAGEFSVTPTGNIIFAAADAVTAAEVSYLSIEGEVFTESVAVAASVGAFASGRKGVMLLSATVDTGIILGAKTPAFRAAVPAAGTASINALGTGVTFNAADVVAGRATVTYVITPGSGGTTGVSQRLLGNTNI